MDILHLQKALRQFAAERQWQPFHTPKNLAMALMVEAAELAEIFQWMTPEASQQAHQDAAVQRHIGEELADVLLYALQLADHTGTDLDHAVRDKLLRNAQKHPSAWKANLDQPLAAAARATHVLVDYENVQPTEDDLRALVPEATQVWLFHGPHQRQIAQRFTSYGTGVTEVPISMTGKNALDFHLAFYMGYIASRDQAASMVVLSNDLGYEPVLKHARAMGFEARQLGVARTASRRGKGGAARSGGRGAGAAAKGAPLPKTVRPAKAVPSGPAAPAAPAAPARKAAARKTPAKKAADRRGQAAPADQGVKQVKAEPAKAAGKPVVHAPAETPTKAPSKAPVKAPAKAADRAAGRQAGKAAAGPARHARVPALLEAASPVPVPAAGRRPATKVVAKAVTVSAGPAASAVPLRKLHEGLQRLGAKRPTRMAALKRLLKSMLGPGATDDAAVSAIEGLVAGGTVAVASGGAVSYPALD
jgi:NTP pyrophosphatase (non-canonical NTP hydrolase)